MKKMRFRFAGWWLPLLALALAACEQKNAGANIPPPPTPILDPKEEVTDQRQPGKHCFSLKDGSEFTEGSLTYDAAGTVQGDLRGTVVDADKGTETIINTVFRGTIAGDTLALQVTSDRTGTRANTEEKWVWKGNQLTTGHNIVLATPCR